MKKQDLLELIKYLKEHDLVKKYNCMYEKYDKQYDRENVGFNLEMLYSLTPGELKTIMSSKNDTESLFRLRMHSLGYDDIMAYSLKCDKNVILRVIEEIHGKEDYNEYDPNKKLIGFVALMDESELKNIEMFFRTMGPILRLTPINRYSELGIDLDDFVFSLKSISRCINSHSIRLISELTSSWEKRGECHLNIDSDSYRDVLDVISRLKYYFQVDSIENLLKYNLTKGPKSNGILSLFQEKEHKIAALKLFEVATTETACKEMVSTLENNQDLIRLNPKHILGQLSICASLGEDDKLIKISDIKSIDELESALSCVDDSVYINKNLKVKVKKK